MLSKINEILGESLNALKCSVPCRIDPKLTLHLAQRHECVQCIREGLRGMTVEINSLLSHLLPVHIKV